MKLKKAVSWALAMCMVLSSTNTSIFASELNSVSSEIVSDMEVNNTESSTEDIQGTLEEDSIIPNSSEAENVEVSEAEEHVQSTGILNISSGSNGSVVLKCNDVDVATIASQSYSGSFDVESNIYMSIQADEGFVIDYIKVNSELRDVPDGTTAYELRYLVDENTVTVECAFKATEGSFEETNSEEVTKHFLEKAEGVDSLNATDFATARLVVLSSFADCIVDKENVIANYNDIYLLQYESVEQAMNAYMYYKANSQAVEPDITLQTATEEVEGTSPEEQTNVEVTEEENPLASLSEDPKSVTAKSSVANVIALIDTGASEGSNVIDRISLIDDVFEGNGHGNSMVSAIVSENPNAQILSIRAMDNQGQGTVSSIVAAIEYAINSHANIINLSLYTKTSLVNSVLVTEIKKAITSGIVVVGAAGNDGKDVVDYIPGSIEEAYIVGACDENGVRLSLSNYGDTVDYNVFASSTSEAAAKFSGYISLNGVNSIEKEGLIFSTAEEGKSENPSDSEEVSTSNQVDQNLLLTYVMQAYGNDGFIERAKGTDFADIYGLTDDDVERLGEIERQYLENKDLNTYLSALGENTTATDATSKALSEKLYKGEALLSGYSVGGATISSVDCTARLNAGKMLELTKNVLSVTKESDQNVSSEAEEEEISYDYSWEVQSNGTIKIYFFPENTVSDNWSASDACFSALLIPSDNKISVAAFEGMLFGAASWNVMVGDEGTGFADALGFDVSVYMKWLDDHLTGNYYIGTPYNNASSSAYPNGDAAGRSPGLNCTALVWHILWKAMQLSGSPYTPATYGIGISRENTFKGWTTRPRNWDIERGYFKTKEDLFKYGKPRKGDIIWFMAQGEDTVGIPGADNHVLIYIGDGTSDRALHSSHGNNWCDGTNDGHAGGHFISCSGCSITEIVGKQKVQFGYALYRIGAPEPGTVEFKKVINNARFASSSDLIRVNTTFKIYSDAACKNLVKTVNLLGAKDSSYKTVKIRDLAPGTYYTIETDRCTGCILNKNKYSFKVEAGKTTTQFTNVDTGVVYKGIQNTPARFKGTIVSKKDKDTDEPVEGAIFKVVYSEKRRGEEGQKDRYTWYLKSDSSGVVKFDEDHYVETWNGNTSDDSIMLYDDSWALPPGFLYVTEVEAPAGYLLDSTEHMLKLGLRKDSNGEYTISTIKVTPIEIKEQSVGSLKLDKRIGNKYVVESTTRIRLSTNFTVYKDAACTDVATVYADKECTQPMTQINLSSDTDRASKVVYLYPGNYWMKETGKSVGCIKDGKTYSFTVTKNHQTTTSEIQGATGNFIINTIGRFQGNIASKVDGNGSPLENAIFRVEYWTYAKDNSGVKMHTWYLKSGADGVVKFDADHYLATFTSRGGTVYTSDAPIQLGDDGKGDWALPQGCLYVTEIQAPTEDYAVDTTEYSIPLNMQRDANGEFTITNIPGKAVTIVNDTTASRLNLNKASANPSITNGNSSYSLKGAEYTIYSDQSCTTRAKDNNGNDLAVLVTDENGATQTLAVPKGTYYLKETKASKGFKICSEDEGYGVNVHRVDCTVANRTYTVNCKEEPQGTQLNLNKASANPAITDGNSCYSLEGAEYTVYKNQACSQPLIIDGKTVVLITDKNGKTQTVNVDPGTYYLKETKASKGFKICKEDEGYGVNVHKVDCVKAGQTYTVNCVEQPISEWDPVNVFLSKIDAVTGTDSLLGKGTLGGAEFTIKFYAKDSVEAGDVPKYTWVLKSETNGAVYFRESSKVSGDALPLDSTGNVALPMGVVTIQETKAPNGYTINNNLYTVPVTGSVNSTIVYNAPEVPEVPLTMKIIKKSFGTSQLLPGAEFTHICPDGSTEIATSDENGELTFYGLQHGNHTVYESKAPQGYKVNENKIEFTVSASNQITITSGNQGTSADGTVTVSLVNGGAEAKVADTPASFNVSINKKNDEGKKLGGAEFTLYSDRNCTQQVAKQTTSSVQDSTLGIANFSGLEMYKTYYMKETVAPAGYKSNKTILGADVVWEIRMELNSSGDAVLYVDGKAYSSDATKAYYVTTNNEKISTANLTIENKVGRRLPETGSSITLIMVAVGVILMVSVLVSRRKKTKLNSEKK